MRLLVDFALGIIAMLTTFWIMIQLLFQTIKLKVYIFTLSKYLLQYNTFCQQFQNNITSQVNMSRWFMDTGPW